MSLVEAMANVAVGFGVAVLAQVAVFPLFGLLVGFDDNLMIAAIFTAISIARSYVLRRMSRRSVSGVARQAPLGTIARARARSCAALNQTRANAAVQSLLLPMVRITS
jgi:hypothetical protein